jgi:hypothetical protein
MTLKGQSLTPDTTEHMQAGQNHGPGVVRRQSAGRDPFRIDRDHYGKTFVDVTDDHGNNAISIELSLLESLANHYPSVREARDTAIRNLGQARTRSACDPGPDVRGFGSTSDRPYSRICSWITTTSGC